MKIRDTIKLLVILGCLFLSGCGGHKAEVYIKHADGTSETIACVCGGVGRPAVS